MVNNFDLYMFNRLLEQVKTGEIYLYFSSRFRSILDNETTSFKVKKSYIDIDENSIDKITFISIPKIIDIIATDKDIKKKDVDLSLNTTSSYNYIKDRSDMYTKYRVSMKINKFINDIFNNEYKTINLTDEEKKTFKLNGIISKSQELEQFVNQFKSLREPGTFELVSGDDLEYWYLSSHNSYVSNPDYRGTLQQSCMNNTNAQSYLNFYVNNPDKVSLLIMKDKNNPDLISSRSLIWTLDKPEGRKFMDRIYTTYQYQAEMFKDYAKTQNWLYKSIQNSNENTNIFDPMDSTDMERELVVSEFVNNDKYPYLDTLKYYNPDDEILTNNRDFFNSNDTVYHLESTSGGYEPSSNLSYEELVEMYVDLILEDFEEYAKNYFGEQIWQFVDDDSYVSEHIENEISYYLDDFKHVMDVGNIKDYIKENCDEDKVAREIKFGKYNELDADDEDNSDSGYGDVWEKLDDLDDDEIFDLSDELGIREDFVTEYVENMYSNYTARELIEDIYGRTSEITEDIWQMISYYIDEREAAQWYAEHEGEDYLREIFGND